jgi:hypothetical protein
MAATEAEVKGERRRASDVFCFRKSSPRTNCVVEVLFRRLLCFSADFVFTFEVEIIRIGELTS